jgi:hypothetical protein
MTAYAADSADQVCMFSWRAGQSYSQYPDLNNAPTDNQAAANQAVDILRRRGGRLDIGPFFAWIPHISYSNLVLADYLGSGVPLQIAICPEDKIRLQAAIDPIGFEHCIPPSPGCGSGSRSAYGSTYEIQPSFFSADSGNTVHQATYTNLYYVAGILGRRRTSEVHYPSQKAMLYEQHGRHREPRLAFFAYDEAKIPMLAADGSAAVRATADTGLGWDPSRPTDPNPTVMAYLPSPPWETPTLSGQPSDQVVGHYRWTRRGLGGRDFGGPEVP